MTIKEISEVLGITQTATKRRLQKNGIKPVKMIGQTGVYDPSAVEAIRTVPPPGRPKKPNPETPEK